MKTSRGHEPSTCAATSKNAAPESMIERVARAICAEMYGEPADAMWPEFRAEARAAIEAMRGFELSPPNATFAMRIFNEVLDVALSSAEQTERDSSRDELNPPPETPA